MNKTSWRYRAWVGLGRAAYIVTWPGIWLVVKITPPRTRIILIAENRLLLTKDWLGSGRWSLPGGGLHRNEPERQGAARELFEETSITLSPNQLTYIDTVKSGNGMSTKLIFFRASLPSIPSVKLQKYEIAEHQWVELNKVESAGLDKVSQQIIQSLTTE
jgi:8-oxo-dGTP diphosphatase